MSALLEVIRGLAYGTVGGLVAMAATTLYIKRLDKKLIASIEATMETVDEAIPDDDLFDRTAFVVAIPRPEPEPEGGEGALN